MAPPSATSATDAALGLRPRRALSSAQLSAEWTTSNPLRNDSSLNSFYTLNFVSHNMGAVHSAAPAPTPMFTQFHPRSPNPPKNRQRVASTFQFWLMANG